MIQIVKFGIPQPLNLSGVSAESMSTLQQAQAAATYLRAFGVKVLSEPVIVPVAGERARVADVIGGAKAVMGQQLPWCVQAEGSSVDLNVASIIAKLMGTAGVVEATKQIIADFSLPDTPAMPDGLTKMITQWHLDQAMLAGIGA